ncbi:MAG TPA: transcriptional repressor [Bacilli bacterium]|nr:transcriptional repressor [Bacilli bacterium]
MEELFKENNIKLTSQRKEIYNIVKCNPSTIKEIISNSTNIDNSTIYRIVELFVEKNLFMTNVDGNGKVYYTVNEEHIHYISCIKCNKKVAINYCPVDEIKKRVYEDVGYTLVFHNMIFEGICSDCRSKLEVNAI